MPLSKKKKIIIIGCGRLGSKLACLFSDKGYQVIIIDKNPKSFDRLSPNFSGFQIVGDGGDIDVLKSVDIGQSGLLLAVTDSDNANLMIAQIASNIFSAEKIIIRLIDTEKEKLISGSKNIEAIYPFLLSLNEVERLTGI